MDNVLVGPRITHDSVRAILDRIGLREPLGGLHTYASKEKINTSLLNGLMPSTPQRPPSINMGGFKLLSLAALAGSSFAAPLEERAKQPKSFFNEVGNSTWVIGNDVWNVTQNIQYANKLWYKGKDRVGQAVGHYVSYSKSALETMKCRRLVS